MRINTEFSDHIMGFTSKIYNISAKEKELARLVDIIN